MLSLLLDAARIACAGHGDRRNFLLGSIGIRKDGATVSAKNGAVISSSTFEDYRVVSDAHAECRVLRKLGKGGILYVSRILKKDGSLAMARPCHICQARIRAARVLKVFYTIDDYHYGIFDPSISPEENSDKIYEVQGESRRIRGVSLPAAPRFNLSGFAQV